MPKKPTGTKKKSKKPKKAPKKKTAVKEKSLSPSRQKLRDIAKTLQKTKGKRALTIVGSKSAYAMRGYDRISTGNIALDYALAGGVPESAMTQIFGDPGAGKTSLSFAIAGQAQKKCRNCRERIRIAVDLQGFQDLDGNDVTETADKVAFVKNWIPARYVLEHTYRHTSNVLFSQHGFQPILDVERTCGCGGEPEPYIVAIAKLEHRYDHTWGRNFGIDADDLLMVAGETGNVTIDIIDALLRENAVDLVILDSIAALESKVQIAQDAGSDRPALQAKLVNEALRSWQNALIGYGTDPAPTIVLLNQTRHKIMAFGNPEFRSGGRGQLFYGVTEIRVGRGKHPVGPYKGKNVAFDKDGRSISQYVKFDIPKCLVGPPNASGSYALHLRPHHGRSPGSMDDEMGVADFMEMTGLFEDGDTIGDRDFATKNDLVREFFANPNFFWEQREGLLDHMLTESTDWMKFKAWKPYYKKGTKGEIDDGAEEAEDWTADPEFD